jgi:hypothetical protein
MKRALTVLLTISLASIAGADALGAERPAGVPPEAVKVRGRILAGKGGRINPKAARLITPAKKTYSLVLDPKGRSLVKVMHRERAEVWGVTSRKNDKDWLKVIDYTDPRLTSGHELWRRMRCNACVILPATGNAAAPKNPRGTTQVTGRYHSFREKLTTWTADAEHLWTADDGQLLQVSLKEKKLVRSLGRENGLPDTWVYQLASDGKTLWIVYRGGVARLEVATGKIVDLPELKSSYARVHLDSGGAWVITDKGTFRFAAASAKPKKLAELPSAWRIAKAVNKGIWIPHWSRRTGHFMSDPVSIGERLFVTSYGSIHMLSGGKWTAVSPRSWMPTAAGGRLWFLNAKGLNEFDPEKAATTAHPLPESCRGRCVKLLATDVALWVAAYPAAGEAGGAPQGGGLARFDLAKRKWQAFAEVNGGKTDRVSCLSLAGDGLWVVALEGKYTTKSAHPGMTTTRKNIFETTGMRLLRYDRETGKWQSLALKLSELEKRLICGQDGKRGTDAILPEFIERISVGKQRIFAATRLVPKRYFGGYWPCVNAVARKKSGKWQAGFEHHPAQLRLQGEQPVVLNISHGEFTRIGSTLKNHLWEAVAQDMVLGLFNRGGTHWAVTNGCVAFFDAGTGKWQRVVEPDYRWYWRATAALEDGDYLYIGGDRGLVGRLAIKTGKFELLGAFKDRSIARFAKGKDGKLLLATRPAPLGQLPVFLEEKLKLLDCDAAEFDGKEWKAVKLADLPPAGAKPKWRFRQFERKGHLDKTHGNFLCEVQAGALKPRYYVKEVFFPLFLCEAAEGKRLWISTYTGLLRLDLPGKSDKSGKKSD